ncbi:MAG: ATP-binding cassette domain-containing protein [Actinomycetota bacterium]|nr:ATP-binding cassette domain-containing protein [Actinomycetota bacterium]
MIVLDAVSKRYARGPAAVESLSLEIPSGEICVLVGPSGCGKTTTLQMINRLVEPSGGRVLIDGEDVASLDAVALRRRIGYVIQHGGLFPHRRVADNVAVVPRLLGWDKGRVARRVAELLELVGLDPAQYGRRFPHELSGGERQRVGVARALAADPPVLLMDEPFGAVDPATRQRLQQELVELQSALVKTIVFVTHDIDEAARLGDRIAVLSRGGVLEQYDSPVEVLGRPSTPFVAEFVGADRGVRRLAVVTVGPDDPVHPLEVPPTMPMRAVAALAALRAAADPADPADPAESRWAVVVDGQRLVGWVDVADGADGGAADGGPDAGADGTESAGERARPFAVEVPLGTTLRAALAEMLEHDIGWLPVVDGGRYLGVLTPNLVHAAMRRSLREERQAAGPAGQGGPAPGARPRRVPVRDAPYQDVC